MNACDKSAELRTGEYHEGGGHQITWALKNFFLKKKTSNQATLQPLKVLNETRV